MPELPEVETVVRDLNSRGLCGCSVSSVYVGWPKTLHGFTPDSFKRSIKNTVIEKVDRRGKYIILNLSRNMRLLIHLRMTGKLLFQPATFRAGKHDHVIFTLSDDRKLVFNDTRKFGRISLIKAENKDPTLMLGPEPLGNSFTAAWLQENLPHRSRQIKPLLLDQYFIAGLGNIYVDEALWEARIHPERISSSITSSEAESLHKAIRTVLRRGIKNCGTTLGKSDTNFYSVAGRRGRNADELKVFRRTGSPCPLCKTPIERIVVGQRSTHYCPACQPLHTP